MSTLQSYDFFCSGPAVVAVLLRGPADRQPIPRLRETSQGRGQGQGLSQGLVAGTEPHPVLKPAEENLSRSKPSSLHKNDDFD